MIFRAHIDNAPWATLVVRAATADEAEALALATARKYGDYTSVELEAIDPDGPPAVVVEDWS